MSESANDDGVNECLGGRLDVLELVLCLDSTPSPPSVVELFERRCRSDVTFDGTGNSLIGRSKSFSLGSSVDFSCGSSAAGVSDRSRKLAGKRVNVSRVGNGDTCAGIVVFIMEDVFN